MKKVFLVGVLILSTGFLTHCGGWECAWDECGGGGSGGTHYSAAPAPVTDTVQKGTIFDYDLKLERQTEEILDLPTLKGFQLEWQGKKVQLIITFTKTEKQAVLIPFPAGQFNLPLPANEFSFQQISSNNIYAIKIFFEVSDEKLTVEGTLTFDSVSGTVVRHDLVLEHSIQENPEALRNVEIASDTKLHTTVVWNDLFHSLVIDFAGDKPTAVLTGLAGKIFPGTVSLFKLAQTKKVTRNQKDVDASVYDIDIQFSSETETLGIKGQITLASKNQ